MDTNEGAAQASSVKLSRLGDRTSRSVIPMNAEVAGIRQRIARLCNLDLKQMQPLKITAYSEGGVFKRHTDCTVALGAGAGQEGDDAVLRYPNRFCTVLIYLSDCESGGRTAWRWRDTDPTFYSRLRAQQRLPSWTRAMGERLANVAMPWMTPAARREELAIAPRTGMAVVHFPCTSASARLVPDLNAEHESEPTAPGEVKYVVQQFCWSLPMDSEVIDERLRAKFAAFEEAQPEAPLSSCVL